MKGNYMSIQPRKPRYEIQRNAVWDNEREEYASLTPEQLLAVLDFTAKALEWKNEVRNTFPYTALEKVENTVPQVMPQGATK